MHTVFRLVNYHCFRLDPSNNLFDVAYRSVFQMKYGHHILNPYYIILWFSDLDSDVNVFSASFLAVIQPKVNPCIRYRLILNSCSNHDN